MQLVHLDKQEVLVRRQINNREVIHHEQIIMNFKMINFLMQTRVFGFKWGVISRVTQGETVCGSLSDSLPIFMTKEKMRKKTNELI